MFKIKSLTAKNFMSIGNATQALSFDRKDLTLVLGENLDLGGDDSGARNGTGKTTIINALSYALFGQALTNIKRDNLVNKTNGRNMLVTIEFELNGVEYKIERGRKYNVLKFYIGGAEQEAKDDNSQGDSRETQAQIERLLGMSHDMFKHVVALNTYTEPFLSLRVGDQRTIIEQLLGITLLTEKSDALKLQSKATKDAIQEEEYRLKAVIDANKRIEEQIESLKRRQTIWKNKHNDDIKVTQGSINGLLEINIDEEVAAHKALALYRQRLQDIAEVDRSINSCKTDMTKNEKAILKLKKEISDLKEHKCYACGQAFHDDKHESVLKGKQDAEREAAMQYLSDEGQLRDLLGLKEELGNPGPKPTTYYDLEEDAIHHRSTVTSLQDQLKKKIEEEDPYAEQIDDMTKTAVVDVDYSVVNELVRLKEHQEFLIKLLTNKDSFIRKRIIDQNLSYLNARLGQYLDRIGLPHTVTFQNDLSVNISELGRELDFDNLSRGERNRLILSLSWAFRDVWESLYHPINLLFIDELIDSGLDSAGVESALGILKKMSRDGNKSVWLVSHRDELIGRVNNIMKVVKENGYTNYDTSECVT